MNRRFRFQEPHGRGGASYTLPDRQCVAFPPPSHPDTFVLCAAGRGLVLLAVSEIDSVEIEPGDVPR
jgi:hypothetical protein